MSAGKGLSTGGGLFASVLVCSASAPQQAHLGLGLQVYLCTTLRSGPRAAAGVIEPFLS